MSSLGIGFLQKGDPELILLNVVGAVDQLPVAGRQTVVHHHLLPLPALPKLEPEYACKWKIM